MHDIIRERLELVADHAQVIMTRFAVIMGPDDFIASSSGEILLDSIITRLQALSENIKKIEKLDPDFFENEIVLDVTPIVRFRDLSSHHYELLNHEIIFSICKDEIPVLKLKVEDYLNQKAG